jgi:hypothetical protein
MPEPVGLNGLLPGRGPGLGAPGRGPGAAPPAWPGLVGPGTGRAWPPSSAGGRCSAAAPSPGWENGTRGTPEVAGRPSSWAVSAGPAGAGPAPAGCPAAGCPVTGCPVTGCPVTGGRLSGASCSVGGAAAVGSTGGAVAVARPFAARLPPSAPAWPAPAWLTPAWPAEALAVAAWPANASLSLRTTGASIVDDAERTNSPISWSLAITALLSTPNSFASSYTRTFATTLPLTRPGDRACQPVRGSACSVRRQLLRFIAVCSSSAHCNLSLSFRHNLLPPESPHPPSRASLAGPRLPSSRQSAARSGPREIPDESAIGERSLSA